MSWTSVKWRFRVESDRAIRASSQDNEGWTDIYSKREYKKMI